MPDYDYSKEFGSTYHGARRLSPKLETWISKVRAEKIGPHIRPTDRVLEYGVGFGWNLAEIPCAEKVGFDLTPALKGSSEAKGIRFVNDEACLQPSGFDVVLCHHVLEHVPHPKDCLERLQLFLRPGGRLLLFVPFERETKYRHFSLSDRAHHLYSWTPRSLRTLASLAHTTVHSLEVLRFRFDRFAALLAAKLKGGFLLYRFCRAVGQYAAPEYELFLSGQPANLKNS